MTQYVICALQMEGFHCWPEADGELAYLKNSHRHIFFITAEFPVHNANREIETNRMQSSAIFSPSMGMRMALVILGGAPVRTSPLKF